MAAPLPLSEIELRLLEVLLDHDVRFMVVGLSAATLQGAPVVTQDVDLWFAQLGEPAMVQALLKVGAVYVPPSHLKPPMLAGPGVELFDLVLRMDGLGSFAEELKHCVEIALGRQKLKVLGLDRVIAGKRAANRPKDRLILPVLQDALAAARAMKRGVPD
ncbi:MAG: hypothetical protein HS113_23105 [Verrucomicrobiales bacterium]|nr:hypothetical protein [Verrucomicrobiales bacterium]